MATTLLEGAENAPSARDHPGHDDSPTEFLHPWAREMYRRGFSFNGGERTKVFLSSASERVDLSDVSHADSPLDGRGLVAADLDDDGDIDLFVHNIQRERHHLYRGELDPAEGTAFLSISLEREGDGEGIGATVLVRPFGAPTPSAQVLSRGSGYASCQPDRLHFGLGASLSAEVAVRWPNGSLESFGSIAAGSRVILREGSGKARSRVRATTGSLADPLPPGLKLAIGERVPTLTLESANGERLVLDPEELTAEGPLTVEIWASYCRPCIEKLPSLVQRVAAGERVIGLSVDVPSERERATALLQRHQASFPSYFLALEDGVNEEGLDRVIDLMRLPIPTELELLPGGILGSVHTGSR